MSEPSELLDQARQLQAAGQLDAAASAYRAVLAQQPDCYPALNNLGIILEAQGQAAKAVDLYRQALTLAPEVASLHYNLGHARQTLGRHEAALDAYREALRLAPGFVECHFNMGNALGELARFGEAVECYRQALDCAEENVDPRLEVGIYSNLATALFNLRRLPEAADGYREALRLDPTLAVEQAQLGRALAAQDKVEEAEAAFRAALALEPGNETAAQGLALLQTRSARLDEMATVFRELLVKVPGDPILTHLLAAVSGEDVPVRAADDYVKTMFDQFADSFDNALEKLNYQAPALLGAALEDVLPAPQRQFDVLDAGCGTGLCGPYLRPYARHLTGVDLSEKMLDKARQRGGYDGFEAAELTEFLGRHDNNYDVILCADTLVYFGELAAVCAAAARALRPGGRFLFSVEHWQTEQVDARFLLTVYGRYSHTEAYVRSTLAAAGLNVLSVRPIVPRYEEYGPVQGLLVVATSP